METVHTRHTISGVIKDVPLNIYEHPDFGQYLEIVPEDAKPYLPEMHRPTKAVEVHEDGEPEIVGKIETADTSSKDN